MHLRGQRGQLSPKGIELAHEHSVQYAGCSVENPGVVTMV